MSDTIDNLADNEFLFEMRLRLHELDQRRIMRWLNIQHTGRPEAPDKPSAEHMDAAYAVCRTLVHVVRCAARRDGTVEVVGVRGSGVNVLGREAAYALVERELPFDAEVSTCFRRYGGGFMARSGVTCCHGPTLFDAVDMLRKAGAVGPMEEP